MRLTTILFLLGLSPLFSCTSSGGDTSTNTTDVDTLQSTGAKSVHRSPSAVHRDTLTVPLSYLMGQFDPGQHPDFSPIATEHADRGGLYLRTDAYEAFKKMYNAAKADGINLVIRSATRNFASQKGIWEAKWTGARKIEGGQDATVAFPDPVVRAKMILKFSSMPGSSRHHWGTDIDLNNFTNEWFETGEGKKIYDWLTAHAAEYGYCQPYTAKGPARPNGYNEERWHWSYMPVSRPLTAQAERELTNEMITGFQGAETATEIGIVENYVLGINPECRQ